MSFGAGAPDTRVQGSKKAQEEHLRLRGHFIENKPMETTLTKPESRRAGRPALNYDARALEQTLKHRIHGEVRFDAGSRALYATDASNYRQVPIGVIVPRTAEDIIETMAVAREFNVPVLGRGGGTSLAGQCC